MLDQQKYKIKISFQGTTYETNMFSIATYKQSRFSIDEFQPEECSRWKGQQC